MMNYRDRGIAYAFHPDGESFRGRVDLQEINLTPGGQSICKHAHKTVNAALTCARKTRADFRAGRQGG